MRQLLIPALLVLLAAGCSGDEDEPSPTSTAPAAAPTGTLQPEATPTIATPAAATTVSVPPTPATAAGTEVLGLFLDARWKDPDARVTLPPQPASPFLPQDRQSVVLYDIEAGTEKNFGPGRVYSPAFGDAKFVYEADFEVWLVDLVTMQKQSLGQGSGAYFVGKDLIAIVNPVVRFVDATTGQETTPDRPPRDFRLNVWPHGLETPDGYFVHLAQNPETARPNCEDKTEQGFQRCDALAGEQWVVEDPSGKVVREFRATRAMVAGPGELLIATSPQCQRPDGSSAWCEEVVQEIEGSGPIDYTQPPKNAEGWTNLFLVDIASGASEFVATASYNVFTRYRGFNWALDANEEFIVWTGSYCGQPQSKTIVFDRGTGKTTELDAPYWVTLGGRYLGLGSFGPDATIDIRTFEWVGILPSQVGDQSWSEDYRFAAVGQPLGHGGLCP